MSNYPPSTTLPTFANLRAAPIPDELDVLPIASKWFSAFSTAVSACDANEAVAIFVEHSFWRDLLALTWDLRTLEGSLKIQHMLQDRLAVVRLTAMKMDEASVRLERPYPDIAWVAATFTFETKIGYGSGVFRLSPVEGGEFKAHTVFTDLDALKGHPERVGRLRNPDQYHGYLWSDQRRRETEFIDNDPTVLIVGGAQAGLSVAARLKALGISTLVVEKDKRVGDIWRNRYGALCLHDPVCTRFWPRIFCLAD